LKNDAPFVIKNYVSFNKTRLIDTNGVYHDCIGIAEAKDKAQEVGLDLVCFNAPEGQTLAFCKIINFGKWKYSNEKSKKKQKKERKTTKELRFSPSIDANDIEHKIKQAKEFLGEGDDVLLVMKLRGRQRMYEKEAEEKLNGIATLCDNGKESSRRKIPSIISIRLSPNNSPSTKQ